MRSPGYLVCAATLLCGIAAVQAQDAPVTQGQAKQADAQKKGKNQPQAQAAAEPPERRSMQDRFTSQPDYTLAYHDPSVKAFGTTKANTSNANGAVKAFSMLKLFHSKEYSTNPYSSPGFWAGNFKFKATDANVKSDSPLASLIHLFKTKSADTKTARDSGKVFASGSSQQVTEKGQAKVQGKIQGRLDKEGPGALAGTNPFKESEGAQAQGVDAGSGPHSVDYEGGLHALTVDDVRAILGKSK